MSPWPHTGKQPERRLGGLDRSIRGMLRHPPFHPFSCSEPSIGRGTKRKILGVRGQSPCNLRRPQSAFRNRATSDNACFGRKSTVDRKQPHDLQSCLQVCCYGIALVKERISERHRNRSPESRGTLGRKNGSSSPTVLCRTLSRFLNITTSAAC